MIAYYIIVIGFKLSLLIWAHFIILYILYDIQLYINLKRITRKQMKLKNTLLNYIKSHKTKKVTQFKNHLLNSYNYMIYTDSNISEYGICVGYGWLIEIAKVLKRIDKVDTNNKFELLQVKEKYGQLRIYYKYVDDITSYTTKTLIAQYIDEATIATSMICENCGKPGTKNKVKG